MANNNEDSKYVNKALLEKLCDRMNSDLNLKHKITFHSHLHPRGAWFVTIYVDSAVIYHEVLPVDYDDDLDKLEDEACMRVLFSVFTFGVMNSYQDYIEMLKKHELLP